jgi:hypothetical protein
MAAASPEKVKEQIKPEESDKQVGYSSAAAVVRARLALRAASDHRSPTTATAAAAAAGSACIGLCHTLIYAGFAW